MGTRSLGEGAFVARKPFGIIFLAIPVVLIFIMPVWQLMDWKEAKQDKAQTLVLLYEVASFQTELLGSTVSEGQSVASAGALNEWKRAAYSAIFAHERLARAAGNGLPEKLDSLDAMLQWILRIQIAGERPLRKEETELLKDIAGEFPPLVEAYSMLIDSQGDVNRSGNDKMKKIDARLAEMIRKHLK
ncbi:MAG: S-adenosylmethionine decarboxylase proenzyme [Paenibacillaceae bacterium]|nr:S-adenosylmethionine decarboxylase proenzyme [Paenibacillaceae bacterium]